MDKISKALKKLSKKERLKLKKVISQLLAGRVSSLNVKKLKGRNDIFRVRQENFRIIYRRTAKDQIFILTIERRKSNTYKF